LYFKKVLIFDLVNIELSGISAKENEAIKTIGVTPVNNKLFISKNNRNDGMPGCYKSIEIEVPDTLVSKITSIQISLKGKTYSYKISELQSVILSVNTSTFVLPTEVKSEDTFFNKLSLVYPFNLVLSVFKVVKDAFLVNKVFLTKVLRYITIILIIISCILCIWIFIKFITHIIPKRHKQKFIILLQDKKFQNFFLLITFLLLLLWPILWPNQISVIYILVVLFYISVVLQYISRIKRSYTLFLFRALIVIYFCFEIIFGILSKKVKNEYWYDGNFQIYDAELGWKLRPNCIEEKSFKLFGRDTVYNVYVSSDKYGRRVSNEDTLADTVIENVFKRKHAIFLGCSITFGRGLINDSSFPSIFEHKYQDFKSYNYGFNGYGPQQGCLLFDEGTNVINNNAVPEDSGFCLYTYIDDHLNRVYGGSEYLYLCQAKGSPDVYINENRLEHKKRSYIHTFIAWFLFNSKTMKYFNITLTYPKTEEFYKRFAGIINYTAHEYWKIKPHGEFYIGLYPIKNFVKDTSWVRFLNSKIKVLRISIPQDFDSTPSYTIKNDGHPTNKLNSYYVREISKFVIKHN